MKTVSEEQECNEESLHLLAIGRRSLLMLYCRVSAIEVRGEAQTGPNGHVL
jgi:hypothetical protein